MLRQCWKRGGSRVLQLIICHILLSSSGLCWENGHSFPAAYMRQLDNQVCIICVWSRCLFSLFCWKRGSLKTACEFCKYLQRQTMWSKTFKLCVLHSQQLVHSSFINITTPCTHFMVLCVDYLVWIVDTEDVHWCQKSSFCKRGLRFFLLFCELLQCTSNEAFPHLCTKHANSAIQLPLHSCVALESCQCFWVHTCLVAKGHNTL